MHQKLWLCLRQNNQQDKSLDAQGVRCQLIVGATQKRLKLLGPDAQVEGDSLFLI